MKRCGCGAFIDSRCFENWPFEIESVSILDKVKSLTH